MNPVPSFRLLLVAFSNNMQSVTPLTRRTSPMIAAVVDVPAPEIDAFQRARSAISVSIPAPAETNSGCVNVTFATCV